MPVEGVTQFRGLSVQDAIDDLAARFIVNIPAAELEDMVRVCFQIELAHWYYEDFVRPTASNPALFPTYNLKQFYILMLRSCELLRDLLEHAEQIWTSFMAYKVRVPVCGAILISQDWNKVLLVKGWQKGASWSFPRGKINQNEPEGACAVREVYEETGFSIEHVFPRAQLEPGYKEAEGAEREPYYIEVVIKEQKIRLYFIAGIPEDTYFATQTRKEISKIDWFKVSDLPTWSKSKKEKKGAVVDGRQPKFYMVTPFISHLKLWIDRMRPPSKNSRKRLPNVPRPINPTPHAAHFHDDPHRALPPHLEPNDDYRPSPLESDGDVALSTSASSTSTEEETADDEFDGGRRRVRLPTVFGTAEEGTEALNSFFFNGEPPNDRPRSPTTPSDGAQTSVVEDDESDDVKRREYERHAKVVQPRPKATTLQTGKLLALLTNKNPVASPPPTRRTKSGRAAKPKEPDLAGATLSFDQILNSPTSTLSSTLLATLARESGSPTPLTRNTSPSARSLLFDSAAPPEADGFGETRVLTDLERDWEEREEKHMALLNALHVVALKPPEPVAATPSVVDHHGEDKGGSEAGGEPMEDWGGLDDDSPGERALADLRRRAGESMAPLEPWGDLYPEDEDVYRAEFDDAAPTEPHRYHVESYPTLASPVTARRNPLTGEVLFFPTGPVNPSVKLHGDGSLSFTPAGPAYPRSTSDGERRTNSGPSSPYPPSPLNDDFVDAPSSPPAKFPPPPPLAGNLLDILNNRVQRAGSPPRFVSQPARRETLSPPPAHNGGYEHRALPHSPTSNAQSYPSPPQFLPLPPVSFAAPQQFTQQHQFPMSPQLPLPPNFSSQPHHPPPPPKFSSQPHQPPSYAPPPHPYQLPQGPYPPMGFNPGFNGTQGPPMPPRMPASFPNGMAPMYPQQPPQFGPPPPGQPLLPFFAPLPPQHQQGNFHPLQHQHHQPPPPLLPFPLNGYQPMQNGNGAYPAPPPPPPQPLFNPHSPRRTEELHAGRASGSSPSSQQRQQGLTFAPWGVNGDRSGNGNVAPVTAVSSQQAGELLSLLNMGKGVGVVGPELSAGREGREGRVA